MAEKSIHIVDLKTADSVTGEEYLVLQDASGITYTQVTDTEAPSFEAGKYFQAQSDGSYKALETCPDNWQTMYNQCYTRTVPDTQKVPVKLITGKAGAEMKTAAEWESENPILAEGQIGVESDTNKLKIGDGSTAWNSLLYKPGTSTVDGGEIFNSYEDDEENRIYKNSAGEYAHAEGQSTKATGVASHTEGQTTVAIGEASHAEGMVTKADGDASHAEGLMTSTGRRAYKINEIDTGNSVYKLSSIKGLTVGDDVYYSDGSTLTHLSFGKITSIDTGNNSVATEPFVDWGSCDYIYVTDSTKGDVIIGGESAHAEGNSSMAGGMTSHAEGQSAKALGWASHAEGNNTQAVGFNSHAEGFGAKAYGAKSHAEGVSTKAYADNSHVEGYNTKTGQRGYTISSADAASKTYTVSAATIDASLLGATISIKNTTQEYVNCCEVTAIDATNNIITVDNFVDVSNGYIYLSNHPEIGESIVSGTNAHAEGDYTQASGTSSHAEGGVTIASGYYSHAEGNMTKATGTSSHAEGYTTTASGHYSHAEGSYTKAYEESSHAEGYGSIAIGMNSHAEGNLTEALGYHSHAEGSGSMTSAYGYEVTVQDRITNTYTLKNIEGLNTSDVSALVLVQKKNKVFYALHYIWIESIDTDNNIITVSSADYLTWSANTYIGYIINTQTPISSDDAYATQLRIGRGAHAEGEAHAIGNSSHAENASSAVGPNSHAEGQTTVAIGEASHAEGRNTRTFGQNSHAEGETSYACSDNAHAEGSSTQAGASGYKITAITESDNGSIITLEDADEAITADSYCAIKLADGFTYYHVKITETNIKKNILPYPYAETTKEEGSMTFTDNGDGTITINGDPNGSSEFPTFKLCETNIFDKTKTYSMSGNLYGEMNFYVSITDTNGDEHRYVDSGKGRLISLSSDFAGLEIASVEIGLTVGAVVSNVTIRPLIIDNTTEVTVDAEILPMLETGISADPVNYLILEDSADSHFIPTGPDSHAEGRYSIAYAIASHAEGKSTRAMGDISHAEGQETLAGYVAHAEGHKTMALEVYSHAEGEETIASGYASHAEGHSTQAQYNYSHAEGSRTQAAGDSSHAEGAATIANAEFSHTEGNSSKAYGPSSHAEGLNTLVSTSLSEAAHAEGNETTASGAASHAEGKGSQAQGDQSHAEGQTTIASNRASHAEGVSTQASGMASHAEGRNSRAQGMGSHAEGTATAHGIHSHAESEGLAGIKYYQVTNIDSTNKKYTLDSVSNLYVGFKVYKYTLNAANPCSIVPIGLITGVNDDALTISLDTIDTTVSYIWVEYGHVGSKISGGDYSHAEGSGTAFGDCSHAEGNGTVAIGSSSHAEGEHTLASGNYSHAEGSGTQAIGSVSHAEGDQTIAAEYCQHVEGSYNIPDYDCNYIHIVGNGGDNDNRSNAHTVDWSGNAWYQGGIKLGGTGYEDAEKTVATEDQLIGKSGLGIGSEIFNDYTNNAARGDYSHAEGSYSTAGIRGFSVTASNEAAKTYTLSKVTGLAVGDKVSLVSGSGATPSRYQYKNFGTITAIDSANNIITVDTFQSYLDKGCIYASDKPNIGNASIGSYSHAEGMSEANGVMSHSEGYDTHANGDQSHAEGSGAKADGVASHAEGTAYAFRAYSHAEGKAAACGEASHAEGDAESTSIVPYSHAEGCGRAGVEGYQILSYQAETDESTGKTTGSYTLTSVDSLSEGMKVSIISIVSATMYEENYVYGTVDDCVCEFGKITEIDTNTNTIKTDVYYDIHAGSALKSYLFSGEMPLIDEQPKSIGVSGRYSHAEGSSQAIGNSSHAEGMDTIAYGVASHSEGFQTMTFGQNSHAEGDGTQAKGMNSHAEGDGTQAKGMNSHAEGRNVIASGDNQHVQGKYNKEDAEGRYAHIIGMGKNIKTRSNGHTVDWSGNAWYKGDVRVGGTSYDDAYELAIKIKAIPHTTVSGTVSVSITDFLNSEAVINYKIYGNSVQNGTPSAENPVEIQSVGDLITDESSEYYGKYKIVLSGCDQEIPIYLNAPLRQKGSACDYIDFESQQVVRNIEVVDDTGTKTIDESFSVLSTPTSEALTLGSLTILSGSAQVTISISSTVAPSEFDLTYFQDINKVIAELKSALTQG